jgi:hypothetical protein
MEHDGLVFGAILAFTAVFVEDVGVSTNSTIILICYKFTVKLVVEYI